MLYFLFSDIFLSEFFFTANVTMHSWYVNIRLNDQWYVIYCNIVFPNKQKKHVFNKTTGSFNICKHWSIIALVVPYLQKKWIKVSSTLIRNFQVCYALICCNYIMYKFILKSQYISFYLLFYNYHILKYQMFIFSYLENVQLKLIVYVCAVWLDS